ncbi:hypothetical protein [Oleiharenicola lentus]|uniref:hypothetical protein n=1 Tax=Oleiharenicola lentus TaxID=2508720 RepID=UPI003F67A88C
MPKLQKDGTPVLVEGKLELERHRPHYRTKAAAEADKPRILSQYATSGTGAFVHSRAAQLEYESAKAKLPAGISLMVAAEYYAEHHPQGKVTLIEEARISFLAWVERVKGKQVHHKDLKWRTDHFVQAFAGRVPASIKRREIMDYLLGLPFKPRGIQNQKAALTNFFNWMMTEAELMKASPAAGITKEKLPTVILEEIEFLKVAEARHYLRTCERYDPDIVAHEIIQFLSGVRADDEMADFSGDFILEETREIVMPVAITKTGKREVIDMVEESFWAWWKVYGRRGILRPTNYLKRWRRIRILSASVDQAEADTLARLPVETLLKHPLAKARLGAWLFNARRRTFCTHHVAKYQSAGKTALILRQRGGEQTLHDSYRGLGVTQAKGIEFFEMQPQKVGEPILALKPVRKVLRMPAPVILPTESERAAC